MKDIIIEALRGANRPLQPDALKEQVKEYEAKLGMSADEALAELINEKRVMFTRKRKLALPEQSGLISGRLQGHARGFGFFIPDDGSKDAFISADSMHGAMHGDKCWVRHTLQQSRNGSPEGEIVSIISRAYTQIVGVYEENGRVGGYITPDDTRLSMDMLIPRDNHAGAKAGDKVVAEIVEYPDGRRALIGKVIEVLGSEGSAGTDVLSIIRQFQLHDKFSKNAMRQAKQVEFEVGMDVLVTRENLKGKCIFTIDGADAKDLDDAISLEYTQNGNYYLGVHIADVSHYVKEGSALDKDAFERATSVYFPDRVLPMLPQELSNGICSLHPDVDRLTLSCFMEIDKSGKVLRHRLSETVINSKYRLVYEDITKLIEGDKTLREKYAELTPVMDAMHELCKKLNERRMKRGSIDFDIAEASISVDNNGLPVEIKKAERGIANRIIEECMLLANETVAKHMYDLRSPYIYRVHEEPDKEKIADINTFLQTLGYGIRNIKELKPRAIQRVLLAVKDTKEENIVSKVVLRAMQKARYSERCVGHFGLAMEYYCHFTSPIRRYPDLVGHRIIKLMLHGGLNAKQVEKLNDSLPHIAEHCSKMEISAMEAERAVDDLKKCEYMRDKLGDQFSGIISGVTSFGFFVELDNTVEGLVRASALDDDYYIYDQTGYRMVGRNTGKEYRLGDEVEIIVAAVHIDERNIDFELAGNVGMGLNKRGNNAKLKAISNDKAGKPSAGKAELTGPKKADNSKRKSNAAQTESKPAEKKSKSSDGAKNVRRSRGKK